MRQGILLVLVQLFLLSGCVGQNSMQNKDIKHLKIPIQAEVNQQPLAIQGKIPDWLNGSFVRNGPVSVQLDDKKIAHWFDGLAMLHEFCFQNGKVVYSNKFLRTDVYTSVFMKGSLNYLGFDSLSKHPILDNIKSFFRPASCPALQNANVNVGKIADNYVAFTEITLPIHFDLNNLNTLGAFQFKDHLPKKSVFESAHPQHDNHTGEQFNYMVDYGLTSQYVVYRYHPNLPCRELIGKIPVKKPAYMHSFAITEHYIILVEYPFVVNPIDLFLLTKPFIQNYHWIPSRGTNFIVIDRESGQVVKEIKDCHPFFAFHHVNAYEEKGNIILDIVVYPDASIISKISQHGYLSTHFSADEHLPLPTLTRYCLSLTDCSVQSKVLFNGSFELPRINEKYNAHPYRYAYGSDQRLIAHSSERRPIFKIDTKTGRHLSWEDAGVLPGEPVFIANPKGQAEDDGVIVSIVLDLKKQNAFLLILDAQSFQEIGRAYAPFTIPLGLHGQFFKHSPKS